jgi:hypothetical protein
MGMGRSVVAVSASIVLLLLTLGIGVSPASADIVVDFSTGNAGIGGSITLFADGNLAGAAIPIGTLTASGTAADGNYSATGIASGSAGGLNCCASLSFNTGEGGSNFIQIVGSVLGLTAAPETLLSGTISSFSLANGPVGLVAATGQDVKADDLLAALGISGTQFGFFGISLSTDALSPGGSPSTAISTDIKNTAVPEPGSLFLLGAGLLGLAAYARHSRRVESLT